MPVRQREQDVAAFRAAIASGDQAHQTGAAEQGGTGKTGLQQGASRKHGAILGVRVPRTEGRA